MPATYEIPRSYVRYERPSLNNEDRSTVEYNVDAEDESWLESNIQFGSNINNVKMENNSIELAVISEESETNGEPSYDDGYIGIKKKPTLPLQMFEHIIDALEKATALETIITLSEAEKLIVAKIPDILQKFGTSHDGPKKGEQKRQKKEITVRTVISQIYDYWVNKRSKLRKPLLRRYWPVTASNDTNPHMVFRPREKEKYKLRKKRQNDFDAFKKLKQLRIDFTKVRALLELIQRREQLSKYILDLQCDWFEQRLYEMVDTSALPRESDRISHNDIDEALNVPKYFDTHNMDRGKKKKRKRMSNVKSGGTSPVPVAGNITPSSEVSQQTVKKKTQTLPKHVAADQMHPPNFLNPLPTRENYATSWEHAVPFISSYSNAKPIPTFRFRHRPRIGRGGRVIIDRIPQPGNPDAPPADVYTTGEGAGVGPGENRRATRMLDLLPEPIDTDFVRCRIEEIAASALIDDEERVMKLRAPSLPSGPNSLSVANDAYDTEEVLVKLNDWMETDEQIFGVEVGPPLGPV